MTDYEAYVEKRRATVEEALAAKTAAAKATPLTVGERVRLRGGKFATIVEAAPTRMSVVVDRTEASGRIKRVGVNRLDIIKVEEAASAAFVAALRGEA